ncbi:ParB/RepB/Spo0J family partition protein [Pseudarthrobacter sp. CCNWLW207]|uniref:ParB/RepB/Spo0J family partition protein n=1 Tax=Pseudarthrobacter sp. CCNWLW207 TaxID=3127468 RepID=UPI0030782159
MSTRFQEIHIDQLVVHPKNVRRDVGNVVDLANSISEQGILQPLVVAPYLGSPDDNPVTGSRYIIIAGHRRHAGAKLANVDSLPCVIRDDINTEPRQLEAMIVENTQRTDLTVLEEAEGYQALLEFPGYSVKSVAKATGRSQATVRKRLLLNKLNEDAKGKLEDHTLNVDQALVLVDFAEDQDATEKLLEAAASGRDWNFTVRMETRRRDAPAKKEQATKDLEDAGAKYVPEATLYTGGWNRIYENEANAITIAEHVAAGHQCIVDTWGDIQWHEKPAKAPRAAKPEMTEEEKEAKRRDAALTAALDIAHAVRAEHIKTVIKAPPEGAADEALYRLLLDHLHRRTTLFAEITGRAPNKEDDHFAIKAALQDMTVEQMALLLHLASKSQEDELLKLQGWDAGDFTYKWHTKGWIEDLGTVYHYELSSVEQEVLDHFQTEYDERMASLMSEPDDDQEEEDEDDE